MKAVEAFHKYILEHRRVADNKWGIIKKHRTIYFAIFLVVIVELYVQVAATSYQIGYSSNERPLLWTWKSRESFFKARTTSCSIPVEKYQYNSSDKRCTRVSCYKLQRRRVCIHFVYYVQSELHNWLQLRFIYGIQDPVAWCDPK